jgi:DNA polymerase III subunit alpha
MVDERERHGPYKSLVDLCRRIDLSRLSRRVFDALIRSGSLDGLGPNRATLMANLEQAMQASEQSARSREAGQVDFFGSSALAAASAELSLKPAAEWNASQRLAGERETLGLFLTGHPIAPYEQDLRYFASGRIADFASDRPSVPIDTARSYTDARTVTLAGLIVEIRRRGPRVSFMLDDRSGRMEVTMFEEVYQRHRELIVKDTLVQVEGALRFDEFSDAWRLAARQLQALDTVRERLARHLLISWPDVSDAPQLVSRLEALLRDARDARDGQCSVLLRYRTREANGTLSFGEDWKVRPSRQLLERLEHLLGSGTARLSYSLEPLPGSTALAN